MIKRKQGDSIWIDVAGEGLAEVDAAWDNWTGEWAIIRSLDDRTPIVSGAMAKGATIGDFRMRAGATAMAAVDPGDYLLVLQISNAAADYRQEIAHEKLLISMQGVTP